MLLKHPDRMSLEEGFSAKASDGHSSKGASSLTDFDTG